MQKNQWQKALSGVVKDPQTLLTDLELHHHFLHLLTDAAHASKDFPLKVPRGFLNRIQKDDVNDPLLKQVLPLADELKTHPDFNQDPLKESEANPLPGLLHKYHGRVLITLTSACAINCRYCFRRHFPYENNNPSKQGLAKIFSYIKNHQDIKEVILSGGDPLILPDELLRQFSAELSTISHVTRLRIHSRIPIVLPERITADFCAWLKGASFNKVLVVHANHPREINEEVKMVLQNLKATGTTLLNQSVLLKDINDDADILIELSEKLFAANVLPYYLHLLDKVAGTQHFDVEISKAFAIFEQLRNALPGYLVPRLVREEPYRQAKTLLR